MLDNSSNDGYSRITVQANAAFEVNINTDSFSDDEDQMTYGDSVTRIHVSLNRPVGRPGALLDFRKCCLSGSMTTTFADLQIVDTCSQSSNGLGIKVIPFPYV